MLLKTKINLKKYFILTALTTVFCLALTANNEEKIAILVIYLATLINQFILVHLVQYLIDFVSKDIPIDKLKVIMLSVIKISVLFGSLYLGVLLMNSRVIIPLLNYVIHIFILVLSFKKTL